MARKTEKRANEIVELLLHRGDLSVDQLAKHFRTSVASARRDLVRLQEQGLVYRTHGGVMLRTQVQGPFRFDGNLKEREKRFQEEKQLISARTSALIADDEFVGLTAGTTTTMVARALSRRTNLRVLTNAVNIGLDLGALNGPQAILTGGSMLWPGAFSLTGPETLDTIARFIIDHAVLGVTGFDADHGATMIEPEEAAVSRAMIRQARSIIIVADSSKVGSVSRAVICEAHEVDVLVTDKGVRDEELRRLEERGVRVIVADGQ